MGEKHAAAAVAGESECIEGLPVVVWMSAGPGRSPCDILIEGSLPFSKSLALVRVDELDVFGPEVADDLFAKVVSFLGRGVGWGFGSCLPCRRRSSARG